MNKRIKEMLKAIRGIRLNMERLAIASTKFSDETNNLLERILATNIKLLIENQLKSFNQLEQRLTDDINSD